jgi:Zn-dependent protease
MRDPFSWSFPLFPIAGILVRIHFLMPVVMIGLIWRAAAKENAIPGTAMDAAMLMGLLFVSVLLHELGHAFAARWVDGDSNEVLLWPLGGLARVDIPNTPVAHFIVAAAGPAVNLLLCTATALALGFLADAHYQPPWNPLETPYRSEANGAVVMHLWNGEHVTTMTMAPIVLARFFYANWILTLFNLLLVGFPMDCGRMLQAALWPRLGYNRATWCAIVAGFVCMFVLIIATFAFNEVLFIALAWFVYQACKQEWYLLENGNDDSVFGYDFSQGYTSLEREEPQPPRPREPNFLQRWLRRRADRKRQLAQETQLAEERRMDQLLEKIQQHGKQALTEEEQRFLTRVASRYRKRSP